MTPVINFSQVIGFFSPELILALGVVVLVLAALVPSIKERRVEVAVSALLILTIAGILLYQQGYKVVADENALPGYLHLGNGNQVLRVDRIAVFFKGLFILTAFLGVLLSIRSKELMAEHYAEFCALLLSVTIGMIMMATSVDMLMIYLGVEMVSILSYVLAGFMRGSIRSSEASLKYLLYGALASGAMIYGMSILYGFTGTMNLIDMKAMLSGNNLQGNTLIILSVLLILVGIGYKMAAVPFHFWCPDVYEGAPLPVTAFFSVGPKAAGFALAIRVFGTALTEKFNMGGITDLKDLAPDLVEAQVVANIDWVSAIFILSILTMTLGNLSALRQKNAKRMLAYSSIAHAGYLLMGLTTLTQAGISSVLFYLVVYALMNLGAFAVVMMIADQRGSDDLDAFRGTFKEAPWVAIAMCIFLFSLTGLPPFAGFAGKLSIFGAVVEAANLRGVEGTMFGQGRLWVLLLAGVINSAISLFYYVRIIQAMLVGSVEDDESGAEGGPRLAALAIPRSSQLMLAIFVVPTVLFGMAFGWLKTLADWALYRI